MGINDIFPGLFKNQESRARIPAQKQSLREKAESATEVRFVEMHKPSTNGEVAAQIDALAHEIMEGLIDQGIKDTEITRQIVRYSVSMGADFGFRNCADKIKGVLE